MKTTAVFSILALTAASFAKPTPLDLNQSCNVLTSFAPVYIGKDKNVRVEHASCQENASLKELEKRQTANVCGAPCTTYCWQPAGGAPNSDECHVIADALRYESQHLGINFQVPTGTNNTLIMTYSSCKTYFLNQYTTPLSYCRNDWASLIDWLAPHCSDANGAHGGLCVANDQAWYVQVQHV